MVDIFSHKISHKMITRPGNGHSRSRMTPIFHTKVGIMRASVECRIRSDRMNKDGCAAVYLQILINSKRTQIPLKISWPVHHFNKSKGTFLPRFKGDKMASDYNIFANKEKAKVNEVFMFYRHSDMLLTTELFHREMQRYGSKNDFNTWVSYEFQDRFDELDITLSTWKNTRSSLKKLSEFQPKISFAELNASFLVKYENWLRAQEYEINTIHGFLKMIKIYARRAHDQGLALDMDSVASFKLPKEISRVIYLDQFELEKLLKYYGSNGKPASHKQVLGQFLFSCLATGMRWSDIKRITWKNIKGDILEFIPYKTRKTGRSVKIPLVSRAFDLIQNKRGLLFNCYCDPVTNRILKDIASECGIRKNLSTHVARHTFATEFLRKGGRIEVLQKLLGHTKISTTQIYAHVDIRTLKDQMMLMEY